MPLTKKELKGKRGMAIRGLANAGDLDAIRAMLEDGLGWINDGELKHSIGTPLREMINIDRDLDGAIAFLTEASDTSVDRDQLRGNFGKPLRDLLNANDREAAVELVAEMGHIGRDKLASDSGEYGHTIRNLVNEGKLSEAVAELRSIYPPGGKPPFRVNRKHLRGSVGTVLRSLVNGGQWDQAIYTLQAEARKGIKKTHCAGKQGKPIRDYLQVNNIDAAQDVIRNIAGEIKTEQLHGTVGRKMRKAINDQNLPLAIEIFEREARTWTKKALKGTIGGPMRAALNNGSPDDAMEILEGAMIADQKASAGNADWARANGPAVPWFGPPTATWAAQRAIMAVGQGQAPAASLQRMRDNGGDAAIAEGLRLLGEDQLKKLPYVGMVIVVIEWMREWPIVGDLLAELDGFVDEVAGEAIGKAKDWAADQLDKVF